MIDPASSVSLLSVDPGNSMGWAFFHKKCLSQCGLWDLDVEHVPARISAMRVVIEDQVIYPNSKARPKDIITLAKTAARAAERLGYRGVKWIAPRTWKGSADPDVVCVNIIKTLTDSERRVYFAASDKVPQGVRHNIIDAIGLGLFYLGRYRP